MTSSPRALALSLLIHGCIIAATVGVVFHRGGGAGGEGDAAGALAFQSKGGSLVQTEEQPRPNPSDLGQPQESVPPPASALPPPIPDMPEPVISDLVVPVESKVAAALPSSAPVPEVRPLAEGPARKVPERKKGGEGPRGGSEPSSSRGGGAGEGNGGNGGGGPAWIPARYSRCPAPAYPAAAKKEKLAGQVLLLVLVDENGRAASVSIRKSSGSPILDSAAVSAVERWRFEPAKQNGKVVSSRVEVPVRFVAS